ncbi:hypothetical protein DFJ74DRAFT_700982 [Hyaloraphidium curvatum]|nr:hypothetical protein DFJ74DRAFT_700982 [Hyaloraphidium curvatum]
MARLNATLLALAGALIAAMLSPANAQLLDLNTTDPAPMPCVADVAFALPNNVPWSPSPVRAPGLVLGPVKPGSYYGVMVDTVKAFSDNSTHGCSAPGTGGDCGDQSGQLWLTVNAAGITAMYSPRASGPVVGRVRQMSMWWSCARPESWEQIRAGASTQKTFDACTDLYSYTIASTDSQKPFPQCADGYFVVVQAYEYSLPQSCVIPGCPAESTHQ